MSQFKDLVLNQTKKIPKGKISTYKIIANSLNSSAYRAVGTALKNNKNPIIIPCHRVINSDGRVGSYAGKKNSKKKIELLKKEGIAIKNNKIKNLKKVLYKF